MICNDVFLGQRRTDHNKAVALGIYFRSRQAYAIMEHVFTMPSEMTLQRCVRGIPAVVGLSDSIFQLSAVKGEVLGKDGQWCVLTFDEMNLKTELAYDRVHDTLDGLVELLEKRPTPCNKALVLMARPTPCNEALVFMARRLTANWKQTLGFFFSRNAAGPPI